MSYQRTNLIARRGYAGQQGLGISWDGLKDGVSSVIGSVVNFYGQSQQQQGALNALQQQQAAAAPPPAPSSGISTTTMVVGGVAVLGLVLLLSKK